MLRHWLIGLLLCLLPSCALAGIPHALTEFVQHAVTDGEIRYWGAFDAPPSIYHIFTLRQAERRGVFLVRQTGARFEVIGADTSLDSFPRGDNESDAAVRAAARLLNSDGDDPF